MRLGEAEAEPRVDAAMAEPSLPSRLRLALPRRFGAATLERQRADHALAVVELEQLLHRLAVAGGRRDVVDAQ